MGRLSFTEYFHLLTGREPTEEERFFLDLLLVAIAEHGMMPTNVAARMTLGRSRPRLAQGAVAAGILGAGPVILGTSEACARLLEAGQEPRVAAGEAPGGGRRIDRGRDARRGREAARLRPPDSPAARPARRTDPRALRRARGERPPRRAHPPPPRCGRRGLGKPLTLNVSMPIAAVMLDLGFSPDTVKAVPTSARTAGLLAHLAEEQEEPDRPGQRRGESLFEYRFARAT